MQVDCNCYTGRLRNVLSNFNYDPILKNYEADIDLRMNLYKKKHKELVKRGKTLSDFANAHHYFGFHRTEDGWIYREWAPAADAVDLTGDFNHWDLYRLPHAAFG